MRERERKSMCVHICEGQKTLSEPLELELWVLGIELRTLEEHRTLFVEPFLQSSTFLALQQSRKYLLKDNSGANTLSLCLVVVEYSQFKIIRAHCYVMRVYYQQLSDPEG